MKNTFIFISISVVIFISILFFFFLNRKDRKDKKDKEENYLNEKKEEKKEKKIKIINLVLFSNSPLYDKMYDISNKFYSRYKNVTTIYYTYSSDIYEDYYHDKQKNILLIKGKESFIPGILDKTIKAFEYVYSHYPHYDYIVRTNISTIVDFNKLNKLLYEDKVDYATSNLITVFKGYRSPFYGINDDRFQGLEYPSGTCIIFSQKLFKKMMNLTNLSNLLERSVIDDVAIGFLIKVHLPEFKLHNYSEYFTENCRDNLSDNDNDDKIFFRNRKDENREKDIECMKKTINSF